MAQVMHYYQYPTVAKGNIDYNSITNNLHITHDFSKDYFDWENMLPSYNGTYSEKQANAVSVLMASLMIMIKKPKEILSKLS